MDVIKIENIYKQYRTGEVGTGSLIHDLNRSWHKLLGKEDPYSQIDENQLAKNHKSPYVWALEDINLSIQEGEVLGFIGKNGAGKSTILKLLSKVTAPTRGTITLRGRVASLLEVGTGFHPELTGRENIYLNGAILGMTKLEINNKFDEIVAFSGVQKYLDTPVKRYSSGMYVRLAFAVAAHVDPDILIVDEVLAVGDAEFQKKCLGKMKDVASAGRTVLFVSHNMEAIKNLCTRAVYLDQGKVVADGQPTEVIERYLRNQNFSDWKKEFTEDVAPGNEFVKLKSAHLSPKESTIVDRITVKNDIQVSFEFWTYVPNIYTNLSLHLFSGTGECVFNVLTQIPPPSLNAGLHNASCIIPADLLNTGIFYISVMVVQDTSKVLYNFEEILGFEVEEEREVMNWHGRFPGLVRPKIPFNIQT